MGIHPMKKMVENFKSGKHDGIVSVCCSNKYVIEAAIDKLKDTDMYLLVEATANQVDQFGGYTGMTPVQYRDFIYSVCKENNFPIERLILGGDHLGPLTWRNIDSTEAMERAKELIKQYVLAGFTKIHLDTSMDLKGDKESGLFGTDLIAERAGILCKVAEDAYLQLREEDNTAIHPVYIIGSEVPIPGGAQAAEEEEGMQVTKVESFETTVNSFRESFIRNGCLNALDYVIGVVVQPGVEFSSDEIWEYDRTAAAELSEKISDYPSLVFEAHSTDYQTKYKLRELVEDGYIILKVGPALTFGFREGAFALNDMEEELLKFNPNIELSKFKEVLDFSMIKEPSQWAKHYSTDGSKAKLERKYSLSDRCRYYMPDENVEFALNKMIENLSSTEIPLTIVSQYMHNQYIKIRENKLQLNPVELLKDRIGEYIDDYIYAVSNM